MSEITVGARVLVVSNRDYHVGAVYGMTLEGSGVGKVGTILRPTSRVDEGWVDGVIGGERYTKEIAGWVVDVEGVGEVFVDEDEVMIEG